MSKISKAIGQLRGGLVETINVSGLPPCIVGMVLDQIRAQVRLLEAQEEGQEENEHADRTDDAADYDAE